LWKGGEGGVRAWMGGRGGGGRGAVVW